MRIIIPSVLLSALLSSTGVQGQPITKPTCFAGTIIDTTPLEQGTIFDLLCGTGGTTPPTTPTIEDTRLQFTRFCDAVKQTPLAAIKEILEDPTREVTVFAPVDTAFAPLTEAQFLAIPDLRRIIELHISPTRRQTSDLKCNNEFCAINTQVIGNNYLPNECVQKSRTKCTTAGTSFQIGPGNRGEVNWPEIGSPINLFQRTQFTSNPGVLANEAGQFSSNINVCNGVVQVVNQFLRPFPNNGSKGGKGSKAYYGSGYYGGKGSKMNKGRALDQDMINEKDDDNSKHDRRKRLLESLVEPNGNIEQLD